MSKMPHGTRFVLISYLILHLTSAATPEFSQLPKDPIAEARRSVPRPNDFVNEDQEEAKTEDDWKNGETPAGEGKKGWLIWVQMACLILATLGLFAKLYSKCKSCCQCCIDWRCAGGDEEQQLNSDTIICYLCNKKISGKEWVKQETGHRSYCAVKSKEHRDILSEMPRTSLPCDNCGELLRIWPSNMGPPYFRCKESSCWSKAALIQNNGTNRFNCFTCDLDTCRECGNAEMADSKDLKDDPLVMAASVFKHRGSRSSVKYEAKSSKSKRIQGKKKNGKIPNGRRKSSYMLNYSESSTSSQYPVPGPNMGANGLIMSPMISMWMVPPAPRDNSSTLVDFHHDQQPNSKESN